MAEGGADWMGYEYTPSREDIVDLNNQDHGKHVKVNKR